MDYKIILGIIAVLIGVVSYIPYLINIFKSETPHSKLLPAGKSVCGRSGASEDYAKLNSLSCSYFPP
jgi:uncharacterized membrane protein YadS